MKYVKARVQLVDEAVKKIVELLDRDGVNPQSLVEVASHLTPLVNRSDLFDEIDFPGAASDGSRIVRYMLTDPSLSGPALYLNSISPGMSTPPHNHGTWAVVVAMEGEELNRIYVRTVPSKGPDGGRLRLESQKSISHGQSVQFMPEDVHSIEIVGATPTRHFHLYGRPLEALADRLAFNLETGCAVRYNANFLDAPVFMVRKG